MSVAICGCSETPCEHTGTRVEVPQKTPSVSTYQMPSPKAKPKTPAKWRGQTWVYLNKAGEKYAVFHQGARDNWEHPYAERCHACG